MNEEWAFSSESKAWVADRPVLSSGHVVFGFAQHSARIQVRDLFYVIEVQYDESKPVNIFREKIDNKTAKITISGAIPPAGLGQELKNIAKFGSDRHLHMSFMMLSLAQGTASIRTLWYTFTASDEPAS
ncbi:hypothetical protein [Brevundimonas sp.]|uniref:hypothetical protein n=1 Tax=Brevundimonas sp. TaxID=1871086 RepID=UPI003F705C0A